jgi:hypothetical protein
MNFQRHLVEQVVMLTWNLLVLGLLLQVPWVDLLRDKEEGGLDPLVRERDLHQGQDQGKGGEVEVVHFHVPIHYRDHPQGENRDHPQGGEKVDMERIMERFQFVVPHV